MTLRAGSQVDATDYDLPLVVTAFGNGLNTVTSTTFAVLPTTTCTAAITNPHPTATLLCLVHYGAWMAVTAGGADARIAVDISGSVTIAAGIGGGGAIGYGEIPICSTTPSDQFSAVITVELPPSATAATFKVYSMRSAASGTQSVNYPTLRLVPLYYLL